jgi:hypothetical protein
VVAVPQIADDVNEDFDDWLTPELGEPDEPQVEPPETCYAAPEPDSEASILRSIRKSLGARPGWIVLRNSMGAAKTPAGRTVRFGCGPPGTSDLLCCAWGRFVAIEVKKPGGKVSRKQQAFLRAVERKGGVGFLAYSLAQAELVADQIDRVRDQIGQRFSK